MSSGAWKGYAVTGFVVVLMLAVTGVWNPFPKLWNWVTSSRPIADGSAQWQQQLGGTPQSVTIAGTAVIVEYRTTIDALGLGAGVHLWHSDADWSAVAGGPDDSVVVVGRLLTKGYQVLDPRTGQALRTDGTATAVWTFANAVIDLRCPKAGQCQLRAWDPRGSRPLWTVDTPGIGLVLFADNPALPGTHPISAAQIAADAGGPRLMPELIGLPSDGKVQLIATASGRTVRTVTPGQDQRVTVVGGRVLTVTGTARDGTCYYSVTATDPPAAGPVWSRTGLNLRTASNGSACKQDRDPAGGYDVVQGVDPYGRQELIAAHDGRVLWRGQPGQEVVALDDGYALVRSADQRTVRGIGFGVGVPWQRSINKGASTALTPYAAVVANTNPSRITAIQPSDGRVMLDLKIDAKVLAVGANGLMAVDGREMAYLPFH